MELVAYLLSAAGLTILIIWPTGGPGAFIREKILRAVLPKAAHGVLDCYICFSFWAALALAAPSRRVVSGPVAIRALRIAPDRFAARRPLSIIQDINCVLRPGYGRDQSECILNRKICR